jgi:hypothetical protein
MKTNNKKEVIATAIAFVVIMNMCIGFTIVIALTDVYTVECWLALVFSVGILILVGLKLVADMVEYEINKQLEL